MRRAPPHPSVCVLAVEVGWHWCAHSKAMVQRLARLRAKRAEPCCAARPREAGHAASGLPWRFPCNVARAVTVCAERLDDAAIAWCHWCRNKGAGAVFLLVVGLARKIWECVTHAGATQGSLHNLHFQIMVRDVCTCGILHDHIRALLACTSSLSGRQTLQDCMPQQMVCSRQRAVNNCLTTCSACCSKRAACHGLDISDSSPHWDLRGAA